VFVGPVFHSYSSVPSLTPDDDVFKHLALTYSNNHPVMSQGKACKAGTPSFNQGITNGAAWYPLTGKYSAQTQHMNQCWPWKGKHNRCTSQQAHCSTVKFQVIATMRFLVYLMRMFQLH